MSLKYEKKDIYTNLDEKELKAVDKYSKEYIQFISECKTERLCVKRTIKLQFHTKNYICKFRYTKTKICISAVTDQKD